MKPRPAIPQHLSGSTFVEAVLAISVLAVAIPLVMGVMAQSGKTAIAAEAESQSLWIVPQCLQEIAAARALEIPPPEALVLAFSKEGKLLHPALTRSDYAKGTGAGFSAHYLAAVTYQSPQDISPRAVEITVEYPAAAAAGKRQKLEFHTKLP